MSPSLNNLRRLERQLLGQAGPQERCLTEALRCLDAVFDEDALAQQKAYRLIHLYGREQLRLEIEKVHRDLFSMPRHQAFREKIAAIFS